MTDQYLVPIEDIETRAAWRLSRVDIAMRPDWAGRPSVPANVAAELYGQLVEERTRLANEREQEINQRAEQDAARRAAERAARERLVEQHGDVLAGFASKGMERRS